MSNQRFYIYYIYNGKVMRDELFFEEERKEVVFQLTHNNDPNIKFLGCIVAYI